MSSPGRNAGTPKAAELFDDVWKHVRELHQKALQDLEAKVSKLKKERCLDAQKLEVFYKRSQQLKDQNKALQDTISLLKERLRSGGCDGCAILKEDLRNNQDQNQRLVTKLKNERKLVEDENRKLQTELQKVKMFCSELQRVSSPEQEEGIIPDSPVLHSSLPVANKLRKHRHFHSSKHVRYAETHPRKPSKSLFSELETEPVDATKSVRTAEVLVPNTCEYACSQTSGDGNLQPEEPVAETCAFELFHKPQMEPETAADQQRLRSPQKSHMAAEPQRSLPPPFTTVRSPDSTSDRSPSLLPRVQRFSQEAFTNKAKRKKEEREPTTPEDNKRGKREDEIRGTSSSFSGPTFKEPPEKKVRPADVCRSAQRSDVSCANPTFNNPDVSEDGRRVKPLQELNGSPQRHEGKDKKSAEATWSLDPELAMYTYDSEMTADEQNEEHQAELADTDCTWISHSLLQRRAAVVAAAAAAGLGQKANDSLDMLFDTTACGDYKSYSGSQLGHSQHCDQEEEEEEEQEEEDPDSEDPHEASMSQRNGNKAQRPTFAHVAVIRKKDERRKLKGTTCKECEIYYAHLPEEEKEKKLSACSRHRFLYIPPSTPENFWEVGFPSTQTCLKRGYIKEEKNPRARTRRRQPFNALFSPKATQGED